MSGSIAQIEKEYGNLRSEMLALTKRLDRFERWAAPVSQVLLPNPPSIKAWRTTTLSVNNITQTVVTGLTDSLNEAGLELEDGSSIIKLRRESEIEVYLFGIEWEFAANVTNNRLLRLEVRNTNTGAWTGQDWDIHQAALNGLDTNVQTTIVYEMGVNDDAVRFQVYQDSGGALNLNLFLVNAVMLKSGDAAAA